MHAHILFSPNEVSRYLFKFNVLPVLIIVFFNLAKINQNDVIFAFFDFFELDGATIYSRAFFVVRKNIVRLNVLMDVAFFVEVP